MKNSIFLAVVGLALYLAAAVPLPVLADEQAPTELEELSLYFKPDQLVEVATRSPKPLIQVAENITIITAEEIEAMNAHTVGEVLNRVPGIIVDGSYTDFGSSSSILIQGSEYEHVLVLVDGIRWGYVGYYYPETNTIPVQIIKRIEIIRGAASSTWGSSLGGVVNIITKDTGSSPRPTGTLTGSYGESDSTDLRGDAAGRIGSIGYYLYAGHQESDGIRDTRFFDNNSLYAKFDLDLPQDLQIGVTLGNSRPEYKYYYLYNNIYDGGLAMWLDYEGLAEDHVSFATGFFSASLTDSLTLNLSAYRFEDILTDTGQAIPTGLTADYDYKTKIVGRATGINGRLTWEGRSQTIVLGTEYESNKNTDKDVLAHYRAATTSEEILAFFINDTIRFNSLTLIPGLRYDRLSIADDQISPSLGLTYQLNNKTLLRGSASKGFRKPYASLNEGDPYFHAVSPNLESEKITSFQVGIETIAIPFLRLKTTLFLHEASDVWIWDATEYQYKNNGEFDRNGVEVELQTDSFYNFSMAVNGAIIRLKPKSSPDGTHYLANILFRYDDGAWRGQLFGHYVRLGDVSPPPTFEEETDSFVWDLIANRRFTIGQNTTAEFFLEAHNLFDEDQYFQSFFPNAGRWIEGGIRIKY